MNILSMLKSCHGAVNKVALVAMCGALGFTGLNLYNYATSTTANREARLQNLVSMVRSGHTPDEYAQIQLTAGNTQFATAAEIAAREKGIFDGGEESVANVDRAFEKGQIFNSGADGLMMNNRASFERGTGESVTGDDGAGAVAARAAAALGQNEKEKEGAAGKSGAAGKRNFRSGQINTSGGNGSSSSNGFGGNSLSGLGDGLGQTGADSISGAMGLGGALAQGALNDADAAAARSRSARYTNGRRDVRLGNGEGMSMEGLRGMTIMSGKVAANQDRAATEGRVPFEGMQETLAGKLETDDMDSFGGMANPEFLDDADSSIDMPNGLGKVDQAIEEGLSEVDELELEKQELATWLMTYYRALIVATICACIAIAILAKSGPWGMVAAIVLTVAIAVMVAIMAVKLSKYVELCNGEWNSTSTGGAILGGVVVAACVAAWLVGTLAVQTVSATATQIGASLAATAGSSAAQSVDSGVASLQQDARKNEEV